MNPFIVSWRALPLWAKLVTFPFILSGIASALYLITVVIIGIFGLVSSLYDGINRAFARVRTKSNRGPQVMSSERA